MGDFAPSAMPPMVFRASVSTSATLFVPTVSLSKEKNATTIREVPEFPSPTKIIGVRRGREDEEFGDGRRPKHSLALVPMPLNPEEMSFFATESRVLGIKKTGKSPKKRGHPRDVHNKKMFGEAF